MQVSVWAQSFLSDTLDTSSCNLEERVWTRLTDENSDAKRLFAQIELGDEKFYCALGNPVRAQTDLPGKDSKLFLPTWVLHGLGIDGAGEILTVNWIPEEAFPEATRIVLRPHDSAFYHADAKEELERVLTQMGVLKVGTTIPVKISALGDYEVNFDVITTEPADIVLMQGDEVALEFEGALDEAPMTYDTPTIEPVAANAFEDNSSMITIPHTAPAVTPGYLLGGGNARPRLPDGRPWNPWRR